MSPDLSYIYFDRKIHIHALKDLLIVQDPNRKSNASNKQWKYRHSQNNLFPHEFVAKCQLEKIRNGAYLA